MTGEEYQRLSELACQCVRQGFTVSFGDGALTVRLPETGQDGTERVQQEKSDGKKGRVIVT